MIPVLWMPPDKQWDGAIVRDTMDRCPGRRFVHHRDTLPPGTDGAVVVVPGRYDGAVDRVRDAIEPLAWALVIVTGDEEAVFDWRKVEHPNLRWWFQLPRPHEHALSGARFLGDGCPPRFPGLLPKDAPAKDLGWSFAGQVNHSRRSALADAVRAMPGGEFHRSPGFTQGLDRAAYAALLARTRIAPCPAGPNTPDTFRVFEALEAGCLPVVDAFCPAYDASGYWNLVCDGHPPFPLIEDWSTFPAVAVEVGQDWLRWANRCQAWWLAHQCKMADWLDDDLTALGVAPIRSVDEDITVLIPTSPIPSHPDTSIIEETVASVRHWLPLAEIVLMIDGVDEPDADLADAYAEYTRRLLWKARQWGRVRPILFHTHRHQAAMTIETLKAVRSPMVLFCEADTPVVVDCEIPWEGMAAAIRSGEVNSIRLLHEAFVHPEHEHLQVDPAPIEVEGVRLRRTMQFSARPHLASTAWYRQIMAANFTPESRIFIEDVVYGRVETAWREDGVMGWNLFRLALYEPEGNNCKRSYHIDGRAGRSKHEERFVA